jgi:hypothetical protein
VARLIDILRRSKDTASLLSNVTVVSADNVCDYLEKTNQFGIWQPRMLPVVTPPFKNLWIETTIPPSKSFVGAHLQTEEVDPVEVGYRWLTKVSVYLYADRKQLLPGGYVFEIDAQGKLVGAGNHMDKRLEEGISLGVANIFLWTLCFMNTRNVVQEEVTPPEKLSKAHQKKYRVPMSRYYVLKVTGMFKPRKDHQGGEHNSPSLHIRAGHFKTYSEDKPLFGKYVGQWWWNERMIGKSEQGVVHKDYEVMPTAIETEGGEA